MFKNYRCLYLRVTEVYYVKGNCVNIMTIIPFFLNSKPLSSILFVNKLKL